MDNSWLLDTIDNIEMISKSYEEKAFYQELKKICIEQSKRINQAKEELDGSLWSPKKW